MARPRTPTNILDARNSFKKHPERKRHGEPQVKEPLGNAPEYFHKGLVAMWRELSAEIPPGVATGADRKTLEMACHLMYQFRQDPEGFPASKLGRLQSLLGQFGMSPSERARLGVQDKDKPDDWDDL